jgi:hypothetical protein
MFDEKSRYYDLPTYTVPDRRGRSVAVLPVPDPLDQELLGYHVMKQGQRLDHLAFKYLDNPSGFWRICQFNNVMLREALSEADEIAIPARGR